MGDIRVVIVDDDALVRHALTSFLSQTTDIMVVGEAESGAEAIEAVAQEKPNVVLMDLHMPVMGGVEAMERINTCWPDTRVLAVTTFHAFENVLPALRAGAAGYLLKDSNRDQIIAAVRGAVSGSTTLSPRVMQVLVETLERASQPPVPLSPSESLSERELDVVRQLGHGKSNREIARALRLSDGTVKAQLANVMTKWNARDRVQVLIRGAQAGIVDLS